MFSESACRPRASVPVSEPLPAPRISDLARSRGPGGVDQGTPDYLAGLNPEQREAVETTEGPVLVLAGAGTGKTRVLTTRLAHILATGRARPWELLVVTFTNKAAREMRERITALIGPSAEGLRWLGTFHSVAAQILRRHAELVGLKSSFTILDTDDQERLLKQLLEAANIDTKRWTPKSLSGLIDHWKNRGWTPEKLPPSEDFANGKGHALYAAYQARLATLNACDFGDLLLHNLTILSKHADLAEEYRRRFRYILVDEYQDTNVAQYLWLRLLSSSTGNVCCVGDDDQSIYGWRGAEVDNILRFEKDFPGARIVKLERNYRSTSHILGAASALISANKDRLGKTLWTEDQSGDKVRVRGVWDGEAESRLIADEIETARRPHAGEPGLKYKDMAVLVRASFQMRAFEERFVLLAIPYVVIGGPRFFERAEIRDAHAYLRLIQSEDDDLAFERIVNVPKRGIGETSVQKILQIARHNGVSAMTAVRDLITSDELQARTRTALSTFVRDFDRWRALAADTRHWSLTEIVLEESGYTDMQKADRTTGQTRLDNLKELVQAMQSFETLGAYLEHVSLVMDLDRGAGDDAVQIMTLHGAKGLEFPLVFLPGWEEGVFPSQRSIDEKGEKGLEEERRLAYVGVTRAKQDARISFAANRLVYGRWTSQLPSRFVDELPMAHVEAESDTGYYGASAGMKEAKSRWDDTPVFGSGYSSPGWQRAQAYTAKQSPTDRPARKALIEGEGRLIATADPKAGGNWARGERVFHQKFGYGNVRVIEGNKLLIEFEKAGEKRVIDTFVEKVT
ncbi:ATP-dependent helicase [Brevundimonas variabilis]|uniref:ATP-dependent helicase n=1 Tax=Brevundimonas variabilis TaxID=74312 RepID=UPI001605ECA8|nr:UvrD-helicase domain-containing protein [Brevundimonas variabilis]